MFSTKHTMFSELVIENVSNFYNGRHIISCSWYIPLRHDQRHVMRELI